MRVGFCTSSIKAGHWLAIKAVLCRPIVAIGEVMINNDFKFFIDP